MRATGRDHPLKVSGSAAQRKMLSMQVVGTRQVPSPPEERKQVKHSRWTTLKSFWKLSVALQDTAQLTEPSETQTPLPR